MQKGFYKVFSQSTKKQYLEIHESFLIDCARLSTTFFLESKYECEINLNCKYISFIPNQ